ncbi:MAG: luciferase family oxidoreductase group 1 [Cellvibrionaceae bacterium]|jgi:luciferase family oxidoreductase group 1
MKLSILDQSPIRKGGTAQDALQETLELARVAEKLGYNRFWISEHHNTNTLAGSAPEVLLAAIGAATSTLRIGSGGIMLPHYSAFKVAETFSMLATLYPDRIDLGIGRAPGSDMETARVLATDGRPKFERFPILVEQLNQMLHDSSFRPKVTPVPPTPPITWMLGSSQDSAILAAERGLPYNFAYFINNRMVPALFAYYRDNFKPSEQWAEPKTMLTMNVIVAETYERAFNLALSRTLPFLFRATGQKVMGIVTPEEAADYPYTTQEWAFVEDRLKTAAIGTPEQVKEIIENVAREWQTDEIMTVTITYDFADRIRSYEMLADVFELQSSQPTL